MVPILEYYSNIRKRLPIMTTITTQKATYTVEPKVQKRVARFEDGKQVWETYTQFNILQDGRMVQFCFNEEDIDKTIHFLENGDGINAVYFTGVTAG